MGLCNSSKLGILTAKWVLLQPLAHLLAEDGPLEMALTEACVTFVCELFGTCIASAAQTQLHDTPFKQKGAVVLHIKLYCTNAFRTGMPVHKTNCNRKTNTYKHLTSLLYTTLINLNMLSVYIYIYSCMLVKLAPARLMDS